MFRIPGLPERDSAEEKRKIREGVITNVLVFASLVVILRIVPYIINKS